MTKHFYTAKGGQGCTVTAVTTALTMSNFRPVTMAAFNRDPFLVAGALAPIDGDWDQIAPGVTCEIVTDGRYDADYDVIDWGNALPDEGMSGERILVTRACYLALAAAVVQPTPDRVVLILEEGRALTERDVRLALGAPVTTIAWHASIARSVDAGLLAARLPTTLRLWAQGYNREEVTP